MISTHRLCGLAPRVAAKPYSTILFAAFSRPTIVGIGLRHQNTRTTTTTTTTTPEVTLQKNPNDILVQQRLRRPLAPHLSIYKWQITSIPSTLTRITGVAMSGCFYLFGTLYLTAPYLGLDMSSATLAAAFGAWPVAVQMLTKFTLAWPLLFHSFNGLRYLSWDMTIGVNNRTVARTGWTAVVASLLATLGLVVFV